MRMYHEKHFTLQEAQILLEQVKPLIEEAMELKVLLDSKGYDINRHEYFGGISTNGTGAYPTELEKLISDIKHISEEGIIIKSINEGLIDFPHIRSNGEEVYLCWKSGEENIKYWHKIDAGFQGRKSIDLL
jgi:hypothetical protein